MKKILKNKTIQSLINLLVSTAVILLFISAALVLGALDNKKQFEDQYESLLVEGLAPMSSYILPHQEVQVNGDQIRWDSLIQKITKEGYRPDLCWDKMSKQELVKLNPAGPVSYSVLAPLLLFRLKPTFEMIEESGPTLVVTRLYSV